MVSIDTNTAKDDPNNYSKQLLNILIFTIIFPKLHSLTTQKCMLSIETNTTKDEPNSYSKQLLNILIFMMKFPNLDNFTRQKCMLSMYIQIRRKTTQTAIQNSC